MRLLLLTDIHGDTEKLEKILSREKFDSVLCAGDLSDARQFDDYAGKLGDVLDLFEDTSSMVKAVPGNMDPEEECLRALIDRRMNIHKKIASIGDFDVVGFGGGLTPFGTPFEPSEDEIYDSVTTLYDRMSSENKIAVIHQPPKNTELDKSDGEHVGSEKVRDIIEEKDFNLLLTGHIHESYGTDKIDNTLMVNPGPVEEGRYGVMDTEGEIEVELKSL
jgi:Icc-related predicted phosphoesterase